MRRRVATLGRPGPAWPRSVARWASSAVLPVEATTCMTAEELRALVATAPIAAAVVEAGMVGVDRVLADDVHRSGAALIVVQGPATEAATAQLEPDAVLPPDFDHETLAAVLDTHARARDRIEPSTAPATVDGPRGRVVAVTGPVGVGSSTVAQALAAHSARHGAVVLADLALDADQHVRHGVDAPHDGVFELAEALRHRRSADVSPPVIAQPAGYDLLCGLRRRQEWTVLARRTAEGLVDALCQTAPLVVADISPDTDGRAECGSADLEDRNALARVVVDQAALVVVVGRWSTTGLHRLVRTLLDLRRHGVGASRLLPLVNGAPRRPAGAQLAARTTSRLLAAAADDGRWRTPICLAFDPRVEACVREAQPLPRRLVDGLGARLDPVLAAVGTPPTAGPAPEEPLPVPAGSLFLGDPS